ncbi:MAG: hypothetical protein NTZ90_11345, partial [Proteobacteria bacterium]|nr:hypothetical protein [Pseudomonadota bacterium]
GLKHGPGKHQLDVEQVPHGTVWKVDKPKYFRWNRLFGQVVSAKGVVLEPLRIDEHTGKRYTFFADPDGLPLELYED